MTKEEIREEIEEFLRSGKDYSAPKNIKEKVAYLLGMEIEYRLNTLNPPNTWITHPNPKFNDGLQYRIKSQKTYRPFTYEDVKDMDWDKWKIGTDCGFTPVITGINKQGFFFHTEYFSDWKESFENWTINGKPCGVKI